MHTSPRRRARLLAIVLGCLLVAPPASADPAPEVAIIAHRGSSHTAPENTLAAMDQAVAGRADFVEMDIRLTRDLVPVIVHDRSLARTTDAERVFPHRAPWDVADFSLAEIGRLDAGAWSSGFYRRQRVPTLDAALGELTGSPVGVVLEVKDPDSYGGVGGIGERVMATIGTHPRWAAAVRREEQELVLQSFDWDFMRDMSSAHPGLRVSLVGPNTPSQLEGHPYASDITVPSAWVSSELVASARARSVPVLAYTVDVAAQMQELVSAGVEGIVTNRPDLLHEVLTAQGRLWAGTAWPAPDAAPPTWSITAATSAKATTPVSLSASLTSDTGTPASFRWAAVQSWRNGRWTTLQRLATGSSGLLTTSVPATMGLRLRVLTDDDRSPVATSTIEDVDVGPIPTAIDLTGRHQLRRGRQALLTVGWVTGRGAPVSSGAVLWARRAGASWRRLGPVDVREGTAEARVRPRVRTRYEIRGGSGAWFTGDRDDHLVRVVR